MNFLSDIQTDFSAAIEERDVQKIESLLTDFDVRCRNEIEQAEASVKQQTIEYCLEAHDQLEQQIEQAKHAIQEQILNAKSNSKKINKYLNV